METSLRRSKIGNAFPCLNGWIVPAILAGSMAIGCGPQAPPAGQAPSGPLGSQGPQGPQGPQPAPGPQTSPWPQGSTGPQAGPGPQAPPASQNGVVGKWRTVLQGSTYTITMDANGQYIQLAVPPNGGMKFAQGGPYQLIAPNIIAFTVTDWSPKTRMNFVPCGDPGNPACNTQQQQNIPQPPNSSYTYRFNGPNTMILSNPNTREVLTFTRVAGQ